MTDHPPSDPLSTTSPFIDDELDVEHDGDELDDEPDDEPDDELDEPVETSPTPKRARGRTINFRRMRKGDLSEGVSESDHRAFLVMYGGKPLGREDCAPLAINECPESRPHGQRPCPFVSCKHHLYLDVNQRNGNIKINFPDMDVGDALAAMPETCGLDVADRGGISLEEVGAILNLTRERIRQLEDLGIARLKALAEMASLADYCD